MPDLDLPDKEFNQLSRDEKFLRKLRKIIESNLGNDQFSVESLAKAMAMSRIHLYRQLHRLTGKNTSQYIREIRLERAMDLLKKNVANVAEIAYQVGFGSPAYFNKCFHDYYGFPPGEVAKKHQKERTIESVEDADIATLWRKKIIRDPYIRYILYIFFGFAVLVAGVAYLINVSRITLSPASTVDKTVAVLPFRNDSPDPENEYICKSLQEEITNQLQKIGDLIVRPRQSMEQFRDTQKDIPTIGQELNAAYIMEGSIQSFGDSLRLWVKLIDSKTNEHLWGELYNIPFTSNAVFNLQARVTKKVAASLGVAITPFEENRIDSQDEVPIEALRLLMRGRQEIYNFWDGLGSIHADRAMDLYNEALTIDPDFASALASKGEAFLARDRNFDSAIYYSRKAIAIDSNDILGNWVLGDCYYKMEQWDHSKREMSDLSIKSFLKTIELAPNVAGPHAKLGHLYITKQQDVKKGLPYLIRSIELNPSDELAHLIASDCYSYIGDYEKAEEYAKKTIIFGARYTCWAINYYIMALSSQNKMREVQQYLDSICNVTNCNDICNRQYWYLNLDLKNFEQAEKDFDQLIEYGGRVHFWDSMFLAYMYKQLGRKENYQETINHCRTRCEDLLDDNKNNYYYIGNFIPLYAIMGEKEKALNYISEFEKTDLNFSMFDFIETSPIFESFRDDPEYKAMIRRVHEKKAVMMAEIRAMEKDGKL